VIFLFTTTAALYFFFLVWLRAGLSNEQPKSSNLPTASVVVAARNEEVVIGKLLESLLAQEYSGERLEFIIVDDHSNDDTAEVVRNFAARDERLRLVTAVEMPPGVAPKKWALHLGAKASKGEILLMTDADCTMGPNWVREMLTPFSRESVGMVLGSSPLGRGDSLWERIVRVDSVGLDALMAAGACRQFPLTASGRNLAVRRRAFDEAGGYEKFRAFISGDDDLMMHLITKNGWTVLPCFSAGSEVESPSPDGFMAFIQQRLRFASKGKAYYRLDFVDRRFRLALALIYVANVAVMAGQIIFLIDFSSHWLLPWFIKMIADGLLITTYLSKIERPFDVSVFLLNEVWHGLYVAVLGALGSFVKIRWKGRHSQSQLTTAGQ
jgi:cellulose synthase/poly-beta-1,6-N-acetylglucosamine synthase-like glycosyltransferase